MAISIYYAIQVIDALSSFVTYDYREWCVRLSTSAVQMLYVIAYNYVSADRMKDAYDNLRGRSYFCL